MSRRTERFCTALHALEETRDPSTMEPLFTDGSQLSRPELDHAYGSTKKVREFWTAYLDQFTDIKTEFDTAAYLEPVA